MLDSSITMSWYFADDAHSYAKAILEHMDESEAFVPTIWPVEVCNVLLVGEKRGRQTAADAARFRAVLSAFSIKVVDLNQWENLEELIDIARRCNLSAYDASYLELAMREGLPLATLDQRLQTAAGELGVQLAVV